MIDRVDAAVGRLIAALDTLGIADETLIVLTSDNGGHGAYTAMPDLRGERGTIFEGGIRVPLLIRLPGAVGAGRTDATPTNAVDLYPTLLDAAGLKPAAGHILDGQSLWTLLETGRPRACAGLFFATFRPIFAVSGTGRISGRRQPG